MTLFLFFKSAHKHFFGSSNYLPLPSGFMIYLKLRSKRFNYTAIKKLFLLIHLKNLLCHIFKRSKKPLLKVHQPIQRLKAQSPKNITSWHVRVLLKTIYISIFHGFSPVLYHTGRHDRSTWRGAKKVGKWSSSRARQSTHNNMYTHNAPGNRVIGVDLRARGRRTRRRRPLSPRSAGAVSFSFAFHYRTYRSRPCLRTAAMFRLLGNRTRCTSNDERVTCPPIMWRILYQSTVTWGFFAPNFD